MTAAGITCVEKAREAWGATAPEWVVVLAQACDASTQTAVAKRLGRSGSMINTVLGNRYAGRMDKIEALVRGELMRESVRCPVLGEITTRKCVDAQGRAYASTNALRIELRRACPACAHRLKEAA